MDSTISVINEFEDEQFEEILLNVIESIENNRDLHELD